jgi:2-methylisocitrate lyase-like PEP mutase family enzyme
MTIKTSQQELGDRFQALHDRGSAAAPLALANVRDGASARIVAASGAPALATTSLLESGTYDSVRKALDFGELNSLMIGEV